MSRQYAVYRFRWFNEDHYKICGDFMRVTEVKRVSPDEALLTLDDEACEFDADCIVLLHRTNDLAMSNVLLWEDSAWNWCRRLMP